MEVAGPDVKMTYGSSERSEDSLPFPIFSQDLSSYFLSLPFVHLSFSPSRTLCYSSSMAERDFFPPSFIGRVITFTQPDSQWKLTRKLREKNCQITHDDTLTWPDATGEVYGTFLCTNCEDESQEAVMRIVMQ